MGTQNNNKSIKNNFINDSDKERTKYQTFKAALVEEKLLINGKSFEHI